MGAFGKARPEEGLPFGGNNLRRRNRRGDSGAPRVRADRDRGRRCRSGNTRPRSHRRRGQPTRPGKSSNRRIGRRPEGQGVGTTRPQPGHGVAQAVASKEVAEEVLAAAEERMKKLQEERDGLETEVISFLEHNTILEAEVEDERALSAMRSAELRALEGEMEKLREQSKAELSSAAAQVAEAQRAAEEARDAALTAGTEAVNRYRQSTNFEEEVAEAAADAYHLDFEDCKMKVSKLFPEFDFSTIVVGEEAEETEQAEDAAASTPVLPDANLDDGPN